MFVFTERFVFISFFIFSTCLYGNGVPGHISFFKKGNPQIEKQRLADENFIYQCEERLDRDSPLLKNTVESLVRLISDYPRASAVYARHLREHEERYLDILLTTGQQILSPQLHTEWKNAQMEKFEILYSQWQRDFKAAKRKGWALPEKPSPDSLYVPFPEVPFWQISNANMESVCEIACALEALKQKEIMPAVQKHLSRMKNVSAFNIERVNTELFIMAGRYPDALKSLFNVEAGARREWVNHPQALKRKIESYELKRKRIQALSKIPPKMFGYSPDPTPDNQRLQILEQKIHEELLTTADFSGLKEQFQWGETLQYRVKAGVLAARAVRLANRDALEALKILMPWVTAGSEFNGETLPEWYGFTVNAENGSVIPELMRTLIVLNRHAEALALCERFRTSLWNIDRVEAECAYVEVCISAGKLKDAGRICRDALNLSKGLTLTRSGQLRKDADGVVRDLARRLQQLLDDIQEKEDIQHYGSGFVRLRSADSAFSEGELLKAYDLYTLLGREPNHYGEAAQAFAIQCLLEFSTEAGAASLNQVRSQALKILENRLRALRSTSSGKLFGGFAQNRTSAIETVETRMAYLKAIPVKREALKMAEQRLETLVCTQPKGLYLGELLLAFAMKELLEDGDISKSKTILDQSLSFFENHSDSKNYANQFFLFPVPEYPYAQDIEGNRIPVRIEPGTLLNSCTAPWYIHFKKDEVLRLLGLISFLEGKFETTQTLWSQCKHTQNLFKDIPIGAEGKLLEAAVKRKKGLVTPDEGAGAFNGKRRVRFILAELFYLNGEWKRSLEILERLSKGGFGVLTKDERGSVLLLTAKCKRRMKLRNWNGPHELEAELGNIRGSKMESRILFECANMWLMATPPTPNREDMKNLRKPFERVIERCPQSHEAERALFTLGTIHTKFFPYRAAVYFKRYAERYPNGKFERQSRAFLNRYE